MQSLFSVDARFLLNLVLVSRLKTLWSLRTDPDAPDLDLDAKRSCDRDPDCVFDASSSQPFACWKMRQVISGLGHPTAARRSAHSVPRLRTTSQFRV